MGTGVATFPSSRVVPDPLPRCYLDRICCCFRPSGSSSLALKKWLSMNRFVRTQRTGKQLLLAWKQLLLAFLTRINHIESCTEYSARLVRIVVEIAEAPRILYLRLPPCGS